MGDTAGLGNKAEACAHQDMAAHSSDTYRLSALALKVPNAFQMAVAVDMYVIWQPQGQLTACSYLVLATCTPHIIPPAGQNALHAAGAGANI
jgi:hypothetical protein